MFQVRGPMMVKGDYSEATNEERGVAEGHDHHRRFARSLDCPTPLFAASAPIYNAAMAMGLARRTPAPCARCSRDGGKPRRKKRRKS